MHTKQVFGSMFRSSASIILAGVVVGACLLAVPSAHASSAPLVTTTILDVTNATTTSAQIGSPVHASVVVASSTGSTTPSGTVNFALYQGLVCSGDPSTQSGVVLMNGVATSSTTTVPVGGLSYLVHYSGDTNYPAADGVCQPLIGVIAGTHLSTTLSSSSVVSGSSVSDKATLSSTTNTAGGTVAYTVYSNNACTVGAQSAGVVAVTSGSVPTSTPLMFSVPGTFYWQAVYSGDSQNAAATSTCGSEVLTVTATTTPPVVPGLGVVHGTVFNDLNQNELLDAGEPGIAGFVINLHIGTNNGAPIVASTTSDATGAYSFGSLALGTYYVEEIHQPAWTQTSGDTALTIATTSPTGVVNFANIPKGANGGGGGNGDGYHQGTGGGKNFDQGHGDDGHQQNYTHHGRNHR